MIEVSLSCPTSVVSLRWLFPGSLSGICLQAIGELLFLWPPGFGAVHSLHVALWCSGSMLASDARGPGFNPRAG